MAAASSVEPAILQATTPLPLSAADKANPSSSVGTASPKKAWKQRSSASNGAPAAPAVAAMVEPGPVIGGPESWPALSESASKMPVKPSAKASDASSGSPSPPPTHQRQMVLSPSKSTSSNPSISPGPNRVAQPRPKPRKNNAPNLANGIGGPMHPPFSDSPAGSPHTNPVSGASWRGDSSSSISAGSTTTSNNFDSHNTNHRRVGHAGNKWRGNGGGSYNNGGRRNQEYFDGNHRGQPRGMRPQYMRSQPPPVVAPPPPPPFVATSPQPRSPYVGPMPFSDMSGQMYYYSVPPPPEMMRGMAFVPHPVASPSAFMLPPPMEPQRSMLLKQIEYYFSPENLCKDTFLRKNMDGEGWVQISVIAGFNKVKEITNNLQFIVETLQLSTVIEVQGGRVRRRENWKKWLLPPEQQESTGNFSLQGSSSQITNSSLSSHLQRLGLESGNGHFDLPLQGEASLSRSSTSGDMSEHVQLTGLHVNAEPGQVMGPVDVGRVLVMGNTF